MRITGHKKETTFLNYVQVKRDVKLKENNGHMNHTFMDMSIEYDLSERQIQTIIYEYQKKLKSENNLYR